MYQFLVVVDGVEHILVINDLKKLWHFVELFYGTSSNIEVYGKERIS